LSLYSYIPLPSEFENVGAASPAQKLVFLKALTPIHAGVGRGALEHVDLPVQRDEFGFPCIWASSFKGAVRGTLTRLSKDDTCLMVALGPPPQQAHEHSSAANFLDARLLFVPARSLKSVWTYVTSPHLIGYLKTYLEALGAAAKAGELEKRLSTLKLPALSKKDILLDGKTAVLNELDVSAATVDEKLPDNLFGGLLPGELLDSLRSRGLVVVDDDLAAELVRRSMLIQYRVRLTKEKTVEAGALWSEEYVPQETIFVSAILCKQLSVRGDCRDPCGWLYGKLGALAALWLGGKETVGKGLLKLYMVDVAGGAP